MSSFLEKISVRISLATSWRLLGRKASAIRGFQATEADGVWHLHRGLTRIADPKLRAILFTHSLEEDSHAEEFSHVYKSYTNQIVPLAAYEREDLYGKDTPLWRSLAFVHVGEEDATGRFRFIAEGLAAEDPLRASLRKIVEDEEGHVDLTSQLLERLGASPVEVKAEYRRVRLNRAWQAWLRKGKSAIDVLATVLLSLVYFVMAPFLFLVARRKLASRFVEFDNNRSKRLSE
jgi:rubrerythrin